jgi:hypothetical protein
MDHRLKRRQASKLKRKQRRGKYWWVGRGRAPDRPNGTMDVGDIIVGDKVLHLGDLGHDLNLGF